MLRPEDAAEIMGISTRKIYAGIEDGTMHYTEAVDGSLLVCIRSVPNSPSGPQSLEGELDQP